jgi:hypothetical protein
VVRRFLLKSSLPQPYDEGLGFIRTARRRMLRVIRMSKVIRLETGEEPERCFDPMQEKTIRSSTELIRVLRIPTGYQAWMRRGVHQDSSNSEWSSDQEDEKNSSEFFEFRQVISGWSRTSKGFLRSMKKQLVMRRSMPGGSDKDSGSIEREAHAAGAPAPLSVIKKDQRDFCSSRISLPICCTVFFLKVFFRSLV